MAEQEKPTQEKPPTEGTLGGSFVEVPFPTFYTNSVQINHTFFDVALLVMERLDPENITIRARVVMAASHAKALLIALNQQIKSYEATFGVIELPKRRATDATAPEPPPSQSPSAASE